MYKKKPLFFYMIFFVNLLALGCDKLIQKPPEQLQETRSPSEVISNNELVKILEKDKWTFIVIPRANIRPGDIVPIEGNILGTPMGGMDDCFPGLQGERKGPDDVVIPDFTKFYSFQSKMIANFIPIISASAEYSKVKYFKIQMTGAKVEYVLTLPIKKYIRNNFGSLDPTCRDELNKPTTHIIKETLSASGRLFFFDQENQNIQITANGLVKYLQLAPNYSVLDAEDGGLTIVKTLPIAYRSEHIGIEPQGWLELPQKEVKFDKGNKQTFKIRNIGDKRAKWWIKENLTSFAFDPPEKMIEPSDIQNVVIYWVDCAEPDKLYPFHIGIQGSPQEEKIDVRLPGKCPPNLQESQAEDELASLPSNPGIEKLVEGIDAYHDDNFKAALSNFEQAKRLTPFVENMAAYLKFVGLSQYMTGDSKSALKSFAKLEKLNPEGSVYTAFVLSTQGQVEKSKELIGKKSVKAVMTGNSELQKELSFTFGERHYNALFRLAYTQDEEDLGTKAAVHQLFAGPSLKPLSVKKIVMGPVRYRDTRFGSEFGKRLETYILQELSQISDIQIIPPPKTRGLDQLAKASKTRGIGMKGVPLAMSDPAMQAQLDGADGSLEVSYAREGKRVAVDLRLVQAGTGKLLAAAGANIDQSLIPDDLQLEFPSSRIDSTPLHTGKPGEIRIELTTQRGDGVTFAKGEKIIFYVSSDRDAYLLLLYQNAENHLTQIYPNARSGKAFQSAGDFIKIPDETATFEFNIEPPYGVEQVWAFAATEPFPTLKETGTSNGLTVLQQGLAEVATQLRAHGKKPGVSYGEANVVLTTVKE
jgi:tetratricopeptide (TPR) repeat protein